MINKAAVSEILSEYLHFKRQRAGTDMFGQMKICFVSMENLFIPPPHAIFFSSIVEIIQVYYWRGEEEEKEKAWSKNMDAKKKNEASGWA